MIGQYGSECDSWYAVQATAPASSIWHQPSSALGFRAPRTASEPPALPIADAHQEHRQDDRERVDRRAQHQPQQARPDHFRPQRGGARKRDGHVDPPRSGRNRRPGLVAPRLCSGARLDKRETRQPHRHVDRRRHEGGRRHVEHAQQVEARQQAAEHRAHRVGAVQHPEP